MYITYKFSALTNGQHIAFDDRTDGLWFDSGTVTASAVRFNPTAAGIGVSFSGKTVWLDGARFAAMNPVPAGGIRFTNDSYLYVGDSTGNTRHDFYANDWSSLNTQTGNIQFWGLGGADHAVTGSGNDWLVGNEALSPLNHVSRSGSGGSPASSSSATISADGRFVGFFGGWTGFGSQSNIATDVFVKDMTSGRVTNEHKTATGNFGLSGSGEPVISADGQWLAFWTNSALLPSAPGSTIFVAGTTSTALKAASTTTDGVYANGPTDNPDISADGRYVVFESRATNLATLGNAAYDDIFVKDLETGELLRVSTSLTGGDANADCRDPKISADGRYVVFSSYATNLSVKDGSYHADVYLWDRTTQALTNVTGGRGGDFDALNADVAYDGGHGGLVVFETGKALVADDTNNTIDVYAYSIIDETFTRVSVRADGSQVGVASGSPAVSGDGRWVVFTGGSDLLVAGDSNGYRDVFVKDLSSGAIALVSRPASGQANQSSGSPDISLGGNWIVFESSASNLAATDGNGSLVDVFRVSNPLLRDTLAGGAGHDTYVVNRPENIVEAAGAGIDTVMSSITYSLPANVENLVLSGSKSLSGFGNALANVITGNAGNNRIDGAGGVDTASYANATGPVVVDLTLTGAQATGFGSDTLVNIENLVGSAFNDRLTGNAQANRLDGGAGNDTLAGGAGDDTYVVDSSADIISEPAIAGTDTVISRVTWTLQSFLENLTLTGTDPINGSGNQAANVITGNSAANTLNGDGGNDSLHGGAGNDNLVGGAGNDRLDGGTGNDTMTGGEGSDTYVSDSAADIISENGTGLGDVDTVISAVSWTLGSTLESLTLSGSNAINGTGNWQANVIIGNVAANTLGGGTGNDTLSGFDGNDMLTGGAGNDRLSGGNGADRFRFVTTGDGVDTITDFASGTDKIAIVAANFGLVSGSTANLVVNGTPTSGAAVFLYTSATGSLAFDPDGIGPQAAVTLATLANRPPAFNAGDILVGN